MNRGDVILVRFPHPSGVRGKKRPAVVVQADVYAGTISTLVVAEVTKNLTMAGDPACLFIDVNMPEGKGTGLIGNSVVSCLLLATVDESRFGAALSAKRRLTNRVPDRGGIRWFQRGETYETSLRCPVCAVSMDRAKRKPIPCCNPLLLIL